MNMSNLPVLSSFAPIYASLFLFLTQRVIRQRRTQRISLGDGSHHPTNADSSTKKQAHWALQSAIRAHGNFAEHVPITLLFLGLLEGQGVKKSILALIHTLLVAGRVGHWYALTRPMALSPFRVFGVATTNMIMMGAALWNAYLAYPALDLF